MGLLSFAFTCFHLLAWPLFALGYPLCASIRAIEANSNYHMHKLVTYWILFSLISLFELAFAKLIEWIPLWPYMKLGMIWWLVLTEFEGAYYCYKRFIQPCIYVDLEQVMDRLYKRLKTSVEKENFLSVAERYIAENGTDGLEKLIASKLIQKDSRTDFGGEKIKAVVKADKKEMPQIVKSHQKDSGTHFGVEKIKAVAGEKKDVPQIVKVFQLNQKDSRTDFGVEKIKAVSETEKKEMPATVKGSRTDLGVEETKTISEAEKSEMPQMVKSNGNEFKAVHKDINKKPPVPEIWVKCTDPVLLQAAEKQAIAKVQPGPPASTEEVLSEKASFENVQKEWTCAVCQVTTTCEANLNSHLTGRKHRAKCDELMSKSTKPNADIISNSEEKQIKSDCAKTCTSENDFLSHRNVKKQWARVQERVPETAVNTAGVLGRHYSAVPYNYDSDLTAS